MRLTTFTYEKADGKISDRKVVFLDSDTELKAAVDLSELDNEEAWSFVADLEVLKEEQLKQLYKLMEEHDLKYRYRQFKPSKMTNINTINIEDIQWV